MRNPFLKFAGKPRGFFPGGHSPEFSDYIPHETGFLYIIHDIKIFKMIL